MNATLLRKRSKVSQTPLHSWELRQFGRSLIRLCLFSAAPMSIAVISLVFFADLDRLGFSYVTSSLDDCFLWADRQPLFKASSDYVVPAIRSFGFVLVTFVGVRIGCIAEKTGRLFATLQLMLLSLFLQWFLWKAFAVPGTVISYLLCTLTAVASGMAKVKLHRWIEHHETQKLELEIKNRELFQSRLHLVKQDEMERRLLAADLHDQVLNDLKQIQAKIKLQTGDQAPNPVSNAEISDALGTVMSEIRMIMDSLCPFTLEHFGLVPALEECLEKASRKKGFKTRFKQVLSQKDLADIPQVKQQIIYRLVQESLNNIVKHAQANLVRIDLWKEYDQMVISIADDGVGFEMAENNLATRGLRYMQLRAALVDGSVAWRSEVGKGTTVEIRMRLS